MQERKGDFTPMHKNPWIFENLKYLCYCPARHMPRRHFVTVSQVCFFFANFGPVAPGTLRKFRPPTLLECSSSLRVLWITFQLHRRAHVQENVKITLPLTDITPASFTAYAPPAHICFPLPSSLAETLRLPLMSVDVSSERREPPRLACRRYFPPAVNALRRLSAPS